LSANEGPRWELQWHRTGSGAILRLALTRRVLRGLAVALAVAAAVVVGGGLAGGLDRVGARRALAAAEAENRALNSRQGALRERLTQLDGQAGARGSRGTAFEVEGGRVLLADPFRASPATSAGRR